MLRSLVGSEMCIRDSFVASGADLNASFDQPSDARNYHRQGTAIQLIASRGRRMPELLRRALALGADPAAEGRCTVNRMLRQSGRDFGGYDTACSEDEFTALTEELLAAGDRWRPETDLATGNPVDNAVARNHVGALRVLLEAGFLPGPDSVAKLCKSKDVNPHALELLVAHGKGIDWELEGALHSVCSDPDAVHVRSAGFDNESRAAVFRQLLALPDPPDVNAVVDGNTPLLVMCGGGKWGHIEADYANFQDGQTPLLKALLETPAFQTLHFHKDYQNALSLAQSGGREWAVTLLQQHGAHAPPPAPPCGAIPEAAWDGEYVGKRFRWSHSWDQGDNYA
eukprot:TRINITY_DN16616_c0_g1_i2.p1 TRINITY_DN16616_c0_g1~~TRINITY_DN16616_c0_g1_i2.p1  ORF type:complete len:383 (+),score=68.52 TRINITY_DN16616_c0_g1_i2:132-1151(+)